MNEKTNPVEVVMQRLRNLPAVTLMRESGEIWGRIDRNVSACCAGELKVIAIGRRCATCGQDWRAEDVRQLRVALKGSAMPHAQGRRGAMVVG